MKNVIISLILFFTALSAYCENKDRISIELYGNYNYNIMDSYLTNRCNYEIAGLVSKYIRRIKVSTGIGYEVKSFSSHGDPFFSVESYNYKLKYLNFPLIINYRLGPEKHSNFYLFTGLLFNRVLDYKIKIKYLDGDTYIVNNDTDKAKTGMTLFIGPSYSKMIHEKWKINISTIIRYKAIPDYQDYGRNYKKLPEDRFSVGLKFGVEYIL